MAAKESGSGRPSIKKQELDDMTTCCICTDVFFDPKALPCIHTFCMKCLQENGLTSNKGPGDEMPCPICRRMFTIPKEGFHGLPRNLFIERLIQASNISSQSASSRVRCDACIEDAIEEAGTESPTASTYCVECKYNLCEECSREHAKLKFTKNHKLVPLTEQDVGHTVTADLVPSVCEQHKQKILDVYCADCKTVLCAICFIDQHKNHEGSHVDKFVDGFQKQMESDAKAINECRTQAEAKKAELLKLMEDVQRMVETLECQTEKRKDEVKYLADEHAHALLQGLCLMRQSKLKEIQIEQDDIDTYLSSLETYNSYCQQIMANGSASDICRAFSDLSARAMELQEQCKTATEREIQSLNFHFRKSELEEFLKGTCENLIGEIEEEGGSKSRERSKASQLSEQSNSIDLLGKEIEKERTNKWSLSSSNEASKEELDNEKANYNSHINELKKEQDEYETIISTLQANNDKLRQEMDAGNMTNKSLQTNINQLKQELTKEKTAKNSLQTDKDQLKQDLDKEASAINSLQADNNRLLAEVNTHKTTHKTLEEKVEELKQELKTAKDKFRHKLDPVLIQTLRPKADEKGKPSIRGLTIMEKELFFVSDHRSEVEVYDTIELNLKRRWILKELINPLDIGSCTRNKCIYIFDVKDADQCGEILRIDTNGKFLQKWLAGNDFGRLSVTTEGNVILARFTKQKLKEYTPYGQLIREINLSSVPGTRYPVHAIKLFNGHFFVSIGVNDDDELHRVCLVDADGKLMKSFGDKRGSNIGEMNYPAHLSVFGNRFVMVADHDNSRVLLLDHNLEFKREIFSKEGNDGLRCPNRILLDESSGRLFVADREKKLLNDGRILIFEFNYLWSV